MTKKKTGSARGRGIHAARVRKHQCHWLRPAESETSNIRFCAWRPVSSTNQQGVGRLVWWAKKAELRSPRLASASPLFRTGPSQSWRDILLSWRWDPVTNQSQGVCVWHPRLPVVLLLRLRRWTAPVHDEATPRRDRSCRGRGALPRGYQQDCWRHSTLLIMAEPLPSGLPPKVSSLNVPHRRPAKNQLGRYKSSPQATPQKRQLDSPRSFGPADKNAANAIAFCFILNTSSYRARPLLNPWSLMLRRDTVLGACRIKHTSSALCTAQYPEPLLRADTIQSPADSSRDGHE